MAKHGDIGRLTAAVEALSPGPQRSTGVQLPAERVGGRLPLLARLVLAFGGRPAKVEAGVQMRRHYPIAAYVGPNGGGKSLAMVLDTLPTLRGQEWVCDNPSHEHTKAGVTAGVRTVLSTVKLLDWRQEWSGSRWDWPAHELYRPFTNFEQLVHAEHCDVLMDEVVGIASSREAQRLDVRVQNVLVQLRRRDVVLRWSAPNWARADRIIREVTQLVTECRGFYSDRKGAAGVTGSEIWAPKRVFKFSAFDVVEFDEWTAGKKDKIEPENSHWFKGVGSDAFRAYDTLDAVSVVEQMSPDGVCPHCGKRQRQEYCKGHDTFELALALSEQAGAVQ